MSSFGIEGAVLIGGQSRRMGRDKALLLDEAGRPWWQARAGLLESLGYAPVRLLVRPGQRLESTWDLLEDSKEDCGPLGGLVSALTTCEASFVALLAVDMPGIERSWFETLEKQLRSGCGAFYRQTGHAEPLAAVYPRECLPLAHEALESGKLSLQSLLRSLEAAGHMQSRALPGDFAAQAANANTLEDLGRIKARRTSP